MLKVFVSTLVAAGLVVTRFGHARIEAVIIGFTAYNTCKLNADTELQLASCYRRSL